MLGKNYVKMGQTSSLSNKVLMDVARSHVVFVTGKRGSGKSYTMASIAEGMMSLPEEITSRISVVMFDTMGIYWTMKYENRQGPGPSGRMGDRIQEVQLQDIRPFRAF